MKYLKISLLVFVLSLSANILAQMQQEVKPVKTMTYTIKGLVVDTAGKAISYPTVSIKRDSTSFDYSERYSGDADGRFEFNYTSSNDTIFVNIAAATKTSVTRTVILATETVIDLGRVALRNGEELAGVAVVAYKPLVTQSIDRINYDIESDPDSKTNTVMDMLRKVPMVTVDKDDKIRVKGSTSYKIYINGKPSNMVSKSPKDVLKSMPASSIKKIEVITDPGAKYDAEGVTAILNIVTQSSLQGYNGSLNARYNSNSQHSLGGYFSTKIGKFTTTANYNLYLFNLPVGMNIDIEDKSNALPYKRSITDNEYNYKGKYHFGNIEMSYEIDSLNLISASLGLLGNDYRGKVNRGKSYFIKPNGDTISLSNTEGSYSSSNSISFDGNIDYQRSFAKQGKLLTLSYNFSLSPIDEDDISKIAVDNRYPNPMGILDKNTHYTRKGTSDEHTFQIDYTEPFADKKHTLEAGLKYILRYNASDNAYRQFNNATQAYDIADSVDNYGRRRYEDDIYHYQHIASAYVSYLLNLGKFGFRVGARGEGTVQDVRFENSRQSNFGVKFFDVVPSVSLSYQLGYTSNIKLSYNNSISRPSITYLNPFVNDRDPSIVEYGNPNLISERSHNFTLNYSYFSQKFNMNLSASAEIVNNSIEQEVFVKNNILNKTYENIGRKQNYGSSLYLNYNPLMFLSLWMQGSVNYNHYSNKNYNYGGAIANVFSGINVFLPWKLRLSLGGGGSTDDIEYKERFDGWYYYYGELSRSFLKGDKLSVGISTINTFDKYIDYTSRIWEDGVYEANNSFRQIGASWQISVSWRFGEMKAEVKKAERGITNDDLKKGKQSQGGAPQQGGM